MSVSDLNLSKMLQVSIDGPSLNIKFQKALLKYEEECQFSKLVYVGSFQLHVCCIPNWCK